MSIIVTLPRPMFCAKVSSVASASMARAKSCFLSDCFEFLLSGINEGLLPSSSSSPSAPDVALRDASEIGRKDQNLSDATSSRIFLLFHPTCVWTLPATVDNS